MLVTRPVTTLQADCLPSCFCGGSEKCRVVRSSFISVSPRLSGLFLGTPHREDAAEGAPVLVPRRVTTLQVHPLHNLLINKGSRQPQFKTCCEASSPPVGTAPGRGPPEGGPFC